LIPVLSHVMPDDGQTLHFPKLAVDEVSRK
jgi:hypothetical protein